MERVRTKGKRNQHLSESSSDKEKIGGEQI